MTEALIQVCSTDAYNEHCLLDLPLRVDEEYLISEEKGRGVRELVLEDPRPRYSGSLGVKFTHGKSRIDQVGVDLVDDGRYVQRGILPGQTEVWHFNGEDINAEGKTIIVAHDPIERQIR